MQAIIRRKEGCPDAILPTQANTTDVGYDVYAYKNVMINVGNLVLIPTGLIVAPPEGYYFELALRSSLPSKRGLLMPHGVGIIDPKYCGSADELKVQVYKFGVGSEDVSTASTTIKAGERIAQLILRKANYFSWVDKTEEPFDSGSRGGFGSTGV